MVRQTHGAGQVGGALVVLEVLKGGAEAGES